MASFVKTHQQHSSHPVIALVAGEASGDTLGEGLIRSLKHRFPQATFIGVGGSKMIQQGLQSFFPMEKLSVMGIVEVLKHLPELLKLRRSLVLTLLELKPDVFIGIDAPDFNFKIERVLKSNGVKTIHYVGPSVWAWREKRLVKIKQSVDGVLVLFPFETPYYDKYQIPVKFVGHPLANEVPELPNLEQARASFNLSASKTIIGLLPGSRMSEVRLMTPVYLQAAKKLLEIMPDLHFLIPCVHQVAQFFIAEQVASLGLKNQITLVAGQAQKVMEASNFLMVTSGTATLEAALMKRPMIIAIKVHPFSYWLMKKLSTTEWIGLPNVLAQQSLIPEFIQEDATPDKLALALGKLMADTKQQQKQLAAFDLQYHQLKQNASELAADAVVDWANLSPYLPK